MTVTLDVAKRDSGAKSDPDTLPAVVYGPKQESIAIAINARLLQKAVSEAGESTIITLTGLGEEIEVLIHDVSFNPERGGIEHVDFYAIERGKELTTNVALEFIGEAPAEKTGATVNKVLHDVEVTCKPSALPSHIDVDISVLVDDHSQIRIEDLKIPEGVTVTNDPEDVVVSISAAREEEPDETTEAVDMDAIEVEAKGKAEEEQAAEPEKE